MDNVREFNTVSRAAIDDVGEEHFEAELTDDEGGGGDDSEPVDLFEHETGADPPFCFICKYPPTQQPDEEYEHSERISAIMADHSINHHVCATSVLRYYNEAVKQTVPGNPEWSIDSILGHMNGSHIFSVSCFNRRALETIGAITHYLTKSVVRRDRRTGHTHVHLPTTKVLLSAFQTASQLASKHST